MSVPIQLLFTSFDSRDIIRKEYRFIHFITLVVLPTGLWIIIIELGVYIGAPRDNGLKASFGQVNSKLLYALPYLYFYLIIKVMAMFVTIPPLVTTAKMGPQMKDWFLQLSWVRFCFSCCIGARKRKNSTTPLPTSRSVLSFSSEYDVEKAIEMDTEGK